MVNQWDTRQKGLDELEQAYTTATNSMETSTGYMISANNLIAAAPASYIKNIFLKLASSLTWSNLATYEMLASDDEGPPSYLIPYFLTHYTIDGAVEAAELTWEAIVTAWANASKTGRLFTVLTIDEMRKTVWQEEFTSFTLKAPGED